MLCGQNNPLKMISIEDIWFQPEEDKHFYILGSHMTPLNF